MTWRRLRAQPVAKGCGSEPRTLGSRGHSFGATFSCLLTALQGWDQVVRQEALGPGRPSGGAGTRSSGGSDGRGGHPGSTAPRRLHAQIKTLFPPGG